MTFPAHIRLEQPKNLPCSFCPCAPLSGRRDALSRLNGSRGPDRQLGISGLHNSADSSLTGGWNITRRRLGLGPYRTVSYTAGPRSSNNQYLTSGFAKMFNFLNCYLYQIIQNEGRICVFFFLISFLIHTISLNGSVLNRVHQFKYLGHIVSDDLKDDLDVERERRALAVRSNMLVRRFSRCTGAVKITLFKAFC